MEEEERGGEGGEGREGGRRGGETHSSASLEMGVLFPGPGLPRLS